MDDDLRVPYEIEKLRRHIAKARLVPQVFPGQAVHAGGGALDGGEMRGRNRERDEHRFHLRDGHQLRAVGGDQVAGLHRNVAGPAIDGGADGGVGELHSRRIHGGLLYGELGPGAFHRGPVGFHRQRHRVGLRARLIAAVAIEEPALDELRLALGVERLILGVGGVARQLRLGLVGQRLVAHQIRFGLLHRRFERPAIDREEQRALPHEVAFMEAHRLERARDLRAHRNRGRGFHIADGVDIDRHVLLRRLGHDHWLCPAAESAPATAPAAASAASAVGALCRWSRAAQRQE